MLRDRTSCETKPSRHLRGDHAARRPDHVRHGLRPKPGSPTPGVRRADAIARGLAGARHRPRRRGGPVDAPRRGSPDRPGRHRPLGGAAWLPFDAETPSSGLANCLRDAGGSFIRPAPTWPTAVDGRRSGRADRAAIAQEGGDVDAGQGARPRSSAYLIYNVRLEGVPKGSYHAPQHLPLPAGWATRCSGSPATT